MADMFNEINEELRKEKMQQFWHSNKYFIIGGIVSAIVFTAGFGFWKDSKHSSYMNETTNFYNALNTTKIENLVEYSKTAKNNHSALAKLSAASLYIDKDKTNETITLLREIQKDRGVNKTYRDLAILIEANQSLDTADKKTLLYLEKKLISLIGKNSTWSISAQETLALIAAKQESFTKAIAIIDKLLTAPDITNGMHERISKLRVLYKAQETANLANKDNN